MNDTNPWAEEDWEYCGPHPWHDPIEVTEELQALANAFPGGGFGMIIDVEFDDDFFRRKL